eukprot:COSAG02_NODE_53965_length_298_cov_1.798995_1_plen_20_part_01
MLQMRRRRLNFGRWNETYAC